MGPHMRRWQCTDKCNTFETVGVPRYCPHCGTPDIEPLAEGAVAYEPPDEVYENTSN
jgi:hypothetical protein